MTMKYLNIFNVQNEFTVLARNVGHNSAQWRGVAFQNDKILLEILDKHLLSLGLCSYRTDTPVSIISRFHKFSQTFE